MVFIDYQNTYMSAREVFANPAEQYDYTFGQIEPWLLGERIVAKRPADVDSQLVAVRIYRGMPAASRDPKGYGACRSQVSRWQRTPGVIAVTRPLRYPPGWPDKSRPGERPQEKGIDVELAIDFATMAVDGRYDVGVLMSLDTDLKPALEYVARRSHAGGPRVEVAAWSNPDRRCRRLALDGLRLWCHWLGRDDFDAASDTTDYVRS